MKCFLNNYETGRTIIVELERGERVIESIRTILGELNIKNAVVESSVGSLQRLVYHRPTGFQESAVDEFIDIREPMEIGCLSGSIIDGEPHFHFVAAGPEQIYSGHLEEESEVLYLLEVILKEIKGLNLERRRTEENVKKLFEKE